MPLSKSSANLIAAALIAALIVYGSLYPFAFHARSDGGGPLRYFLSTWSIAPGRGDAIANVLLYVPLGFFGVLATDARRSGWHRALAVIMIGALLSVTMELAQYYDSGRTTAVSDFYTNTGGTLIGAGAGLVIGGSFHFSILRDIGERPVPSLLIFSWMLYRLYPFVPTIDLHKYWNTLKPVVLTPTLTAYDLLRHTAIWLTLYALIAIIARERRPLLIVPLFAGAVLLAKILIIDATLSLAEILGAAVAVLVWLMLRRTPERAGAAIVAATLGAAVVAARLEPFTLLAVARPFDWVPFDGLMHGSIEVNVRSFLEKFFLYGSLVYLLARTGLRLPAAALLTASVLLGTSWAERWLPHRSAEMTDAMLALAAAAIFALMDAGGAPRDRARVAAPSAAPDR